MENEAEKQGFFCKLSPEIQVKVFEQLGEQDLCSVFFLSHHYKDVIKEYFTREIHLEIDFSNCHMSWMKDYSCNNLHKFFLFLQTDQDDDNKLVFVKEIIFDNQNRICLPEKTNILKKKIVLFPLRGTLEFVLLDDKESICSDRCAVFPENMGYLDFKDYDLRNGLKNIKGPEKSKIHNLAEFMLEVYMDQEPCLKANHCTFKWYNIAEERKYFRKLKRKRMVSFLQDKMSELYEDIDLNNSAFKPMLAQAFAQNGLESSDED